MSEEMARTEAIEVLKDIVSKPMLYSNHIIGACRVALASLETDEAYQLEYERTTKDDLAFSSGLEKNSKKLEKNFGESDCISRSDVLKLMQDNWHTHNGDWAMQESMDDIRALPSLTPQPRKGHWINKYHSFESCSAECSSCHKRSDGYMHDNGFSLECKYYDFCPNCGSDNREVEE